MEEERVKVSQCKERKHISPRQRLHLIERLQANIDIATATRYRRVHAWENIVLPFWKQLTNELNDLAKNKNKRSVTEWLQVWSNWCMKVRTKCHRISNSLRAENGHLAVSNECLSDIDMSIFDIITRTEEHAKSLKKGKKKLAALMESEPVSISTPESTAPGPNLSLSNQHQKNTHEDMASSVEARKRTSTEDSTVSQVNLVECRVCLKYGWAGSQCLEMFSPWSMNPELSIASYFNKVTNIEVSSSDKAKHYICKKCLSELQFCVVFIEKAHISEKKLQDRYSVILNTKVSLWPKPIQVDKCLASTHNIEVEVKQEVLSEDEMAPMETCNEELLTDIKVEPEDYDSYGCSPQNMDTISITPLPEDDNMNSDINENEVENYLEERVKEEALSDTESDVSLDLPLDCMLCTKSFNSISGLKAHVIAHHSYLTIARKTSSTPIYQCCTCRLPFITHTDLIVHETCHGQYACYMCNSKFETFVLLTKHRKRCRNNGNHISRLKTLEDVKRSSSDPHLRTAEPTTESQYLQAKTAELNSKEPETNSTKIKVEPVHNEADSNDIEIKAEISYNKITNDKASPPHDTVNTVSQNLTNISSHDSNLKELINTDCQSYTVTQLQASCDVKLPQKDDTILSYIITNHQDDKIPYDKSSNSSNSELSSHSDHDTNNDTPALDNSNSKVIYNSDYEMKTPNSEVNKSTSELKTSNFETKNSISDIKHSDSDVNTLSSEVHNHNSETNNPKTESTAPNPELDNTNINEKGNVKFDSSLERDISMDDSNTELSNSSEDFHLRLDVSLSDTNSLTPENNINETISTDLRQIESPETKDTSTNSKVSNANALVVDSLSDSGILVSDSNLVCDSDNVASLSGTTVSENNLITDNDDIISGKDAVSNANLATNKTECANNKSLEISVNENIPNSETDSMKIHLAIHSLEKKMESKDVDDEEMIENLNEDKVL